MKSHLFFLFGMLMLMNYAQGQKVLLMDTFGKKKAHTFYIGETIEFKLTGSEEYYEMQITDMDDAKQSLFLGLTEIPISRITEIRLGNRAPFLRTLGRMVAVFGVSWSVITAVEFARGSKMVGPITVAVGVAAMGIGAVFGFTKWFSKKRFKINQHRQLRIRNLTP